MNDADAGIAERQPGLDQRRIDPRYLSDGVRKPSPVWAESQALREVLDAVRNKKTIDATGRTLLTEALKKQLATLLLYRHVLTHRQSAAKHSGTASEATLYLIVFPGEGRDHTGIKELNDKVLGYDYCSKFIRLRQAAIDLIFNPITPLGSSFITVGQDYKTATILAVGKTREEFRDELVKLDAKLKEVLLQVLYDAEKDPDTPESRRKEIRELIRVLKKKRKKPYQFDFIFGAIKRSVTQYSPIETVFLLLTEALKAAGIARFIAKATAVVEKSGRTFVNGKIAAAHNSKMDPAALDTRGKQFDKNDFMRATGAAQAVREVMSSNTNSDPLITEYIHIFVNGVWTFPFIMYDPPDENRLIANPDVVRDARKRALAPPKVRGEGIKNVFLAQVTLLELWLVALNVLDLVKDFLVPEFRTLLVKYHDTLSAALDDVTNSGGTIKDPVRLEMVLTRDLRQENFRTLPVQGRASEFQFYSYTSDYSDRIFFAMDVRDLGVDLMVPYELSNDAIQMRKLANVKLMEETFWSSDPINRRKRATYEAVKHVFWTMHRRPHSDWQRDAVRAFGEGRATDGQIPEFDKSLQVMMGGDEIFVAAHPSYAGREPEIVRRLDAWDIGGVPLNLRVAVVYSSAKRPPSSGTPTQRELNVQAHDQALALAGEASETLKKLERTHRRIQRLIEKLQLSGNQKKKAKADQYQKDLEKLGLMKLFARAKYFHALPLPPLKFRLLLTAFRKGDAQAAHKTGNFDLIDFLGNEVDIENLTRRAENLWVEVKREAGLLNYWVDPPPLQKRAPQKPKVVDWLEQVLEVKFKKIIEEWFNDDKKKQGGGGSQVKTA